MTLPEFRILWPQRIAAIFLLLYLVQCTWVIGRAPLSESDYRYALCGREMWEKPSPMAGYFTSCGNMQGDGVLAYRAAGLPLTVTILALRVNDWAFRTIDHMRPPEKRTYVENPLTGSTRDLRHQIVGIPYLLRIPFALFGVLAGGGVWWVSRRLFGNLGGCIAIALYCFSPAVIRYSTTPNNEILALGGLYGLIYTAVGIAHAMYGPKRKWKPRLVLFTVALGVTAASHLLAALFGFIVSAILMLYVAERRRSAVPSILAFTGTGGLVLLLAAFSFRIHTFLYAFTGGAARLTLSLEAAKLYLEHINNLPTTAALAVSLLLFVAVPRSRYFGNAVPLVVALCLLLVVTTQVSSAPWLWAVPFLITFAAGVFADALETKHRKLYLALAGTMVLAQAMLCVMSLPSMHR